MERDPAALQEKGKGSKRKHGQDADAAAGAAASAADAAERQQQQQNITPAQHQWAVTQQSQRQLEWAAHLAEHQQWAVQQPQWAEHVAAPSTDVDIQKLLAELERQQDLQKRQQDYENQQNHLQILASVDAAFESYPLAATRGIHLATKFLRDWYPCIGEHFTAEGFSDLALFLAQPQLVKYQVDNGFPPLTSEDVNAELGRLDAFYFERAGAQENAVFDERAKAEYADAVAAKVEMPKYDAALAATTEAADEGGASSSGHMAAPVSPSALRMTPATPDGESAEEQEEQLGMASTDDYGFEEEGAMASADDYGFEYDDEHLESMYESDDEADQVGTSSS
jgi:hypothetical protein